MSFTYTQSGPNPVGTLNLNTAHLKLTYQDKKLIFFNNVSLGGSGSNIVASNAVQAPGFQFANTASNGIVYASNGVMTTAGSGFTIAGDTLTVPNLTLTGNLQVNGTVTTVNTTTLVITDPVVQIGSNITDTTNVGLIFTSGPSFANVAFGFTPASNTMILTGTASSAYGTDMDVTSQVNLSVNGVLTANAFIGDGGLLSNISGSTLSNLQDVTTNGNVTTDYVTLGGLTTSDAMVNGLGVASNGGVSVILTTQDGNSGASLGHHTVAIGNYAATTDQQYGATAVGNYAGNYNQGFEATAIGDKAGRENQGSQAVAIGHRVGYGSQGYQATALGAYAAQDSQGYQGVAIGYYTAQSSQGEQAVAIGTYAGQSSQGSSSVAIGTYAGTEYQGSHAVSIGNYAGQTSQAYGATAIGNYAGVYSQGYEATAIGDKSGESYQGSRAVAIGHRTGYDSQGSSAVAIGAYAGQFSQGSAGIAIGLYAAQNGQGQNAVAIGYRAGETSQPANSIMLNASGASFNASNTGFYVNPVRYVAGGSSNVLGYNTSTGEIFDTGSSGSGAQTLQQVMDLGANSNVTMNLTNATTGLDVSSNVIIGGSIEMPGGNMNAYSVSLMSAAIDTLNANQINAGILGLTGNLSAHANVVVDQGLSAQTVQATSVASVGATIYGTTTSEKVVSNAVTSNVLISENILTTDASVTGDLTVDGVTTVQILKFTPYSGIDPDTGNASVIATATGNTVTVNAAGVVYGSNVINLSGYTSPIRAFNLNVDVNAQIYLFAQGVSVNTLSTSTVKYTNPTPITNSNVLFHVTTIAYAGFSVVNAIVVN